MNRLRDPGQTPQDFVVRPPQDSGLSTQDFVILGGGLGGLLAGACCARAGARVTIVERLAWTGGRFTTHWRDGFGLSSGALHFVPHGATGPLAQMLANLGLDGLIEPARIFGSVREGDQHVVLRRPADILRLCSPAEALELVQQLLRLKCQPRPASTFAAWLAGAPPRLVELWRTFADFALSLPLERISAAEMRAIVRSVAVLGDPGIVRGGCGSISQALEGCIRERGGTFLLHTEATAISGARVEVVDRQTGARRTLTAQRVISDIGPAATARLLDLNGDPTAALWRAASQSRAAAGIKIHLAAGRSHIPHAGIMFCLGTRRLTGAVQPTNVAPSLAPAGQHLLVAFGSLRSTDLRLERELALQDAQELFPGARVLACTSFGDERWPVNRAAQGWDAHGELGGVYLVGDGCKPSGFMMADGVAKSVEAALIRMGSGSVDVGRRGGMVEYLRRSLRAA